MIPSRYFHQLDSLRQVSAAVVVGMLLSGFLAVSPSFATTTIVDSGGFEGFAPGNLDGQAGWADAGGGASSATIQSAVAESGLQAVRVDKGALSDDRWAVPLSGSGFPNNRFILVDWDMNVTGTGAVGAFGPFFGVDTYKAPVGLSVLGSLGVDATTGDVLYQQENTGFLAETGFSVNFGDWNNFQILLDFQDDEYSIFFNDTFLLTTGFVDGAASTFTDADIATFAAAGDAISQNQTGTAYFDNFRVLGISPADFNVDGDVDTDDYATWEAAFGAGAGGDADNDGDTDGADFLIWQQDYDGVAPLSSFIATVPEPTTLSFALLSLLLCTHRRR